jgi:putative endonuclease
MKTHEYYVYILTNKANAVLYVGVTNNLQSRVYDHKHKTYKGFTAKYDAISWCTMKNFNGYRML